MIYFIQCNKAVKIGFTNNISRRLLELQAANPCKLCILGIMDGGKDLERLIHRYLYKFKIRHEWYRLNEQVKDFINKKAQKII